MSMPVQYQHDTWRHPSPVNEVLEEALPWYLLHYTLRAYLMEVPTSPDIILRWGLCQASDEPRSWLCVNSCLLPCSCLAHQEAACRPGSGDWLIKQVSLLLWGCFNQGQAAMGGVISLAAPELEFAEWPERRITSLLSACICVFTDRHICILFWLGLRLRSCGLEF